MNSSGTQLEYHSLETVDLNSTQTLTNKLLSTNCSYTGNVIEKDFLDNTLVDLSTSQTLTNKTLKNSSLNHNSNQTTNIGSNSSQTNINGFLNLNSGNDRAVIRNNGDDNHSIYLRKDIAGVDNRLSFYEWDKINFYTGARSTNASSMPLRFSINEVGCEATGNLSVVGDLTGNSISVRDIKLLENIADNGSNYINIKAPASLSSDFTLNVKGEDGTIALISDIPSITATNPININNNVISIGGLTNFGSANQIIQVNSTGSGFVYANLPSSLTATNPLNINNNVISLAGLTNLGSANQVITVNSLGTGFTYTTLNNLTNNDVNTLIQNSNNISTYAGTVFNTTACNIGNGTGTIYARNTFINGKDVVINSTNATTTLQIAGNDIMIISSSMLASRTKFLLSSSNTSLDPISADFELHKNNAADTILLIHNSNTTNNAVAKLLFKSVSNVCGLEFTKTNEEFKTSGMKIFDIQIWSGSSNNSKLLLNNSITISKQTLLVSSISTGRDDSNTNFEVNNGGNFTKMLLKTTATNKDVELAFKNGNTQGQIRMLGTTNSLDFQDFPAYIFNNYTKINYNNANSLLALTSNVSNSKIGLHLFQGTTEVKLYYDYGSEHLVYESPASDSTGQRFKINGQAPSIVDANGRGLIFRTNTGSFSGVQLGNAVDNVKINTGSYIQIDGGAIDMDYNKIRFRGQGDDNHLIEYYAGVDGPKMKGYEGITFHTRYGEAIKVYNDGTTPKLNAPNGVTFNSDDRIKFNEAPVINAIDTIKKLKPVFYNKASELDYEGDTKTLPTEYGFIAQDTYNNVPELRQSVIFDKTLPRNFVNNDLNGDCVEDIYNKTTNSDGETTIYRDICAFNYDNLHAINVKAIQELLLEIELLKNRINQLESSSS